MNRKSWLTMIGTVGVAATIATGCKDQSVRDYLGPGGKMVKYLDVLSDAVCELEGKVTGLDPNKRICPGGPGDKKPTPTYP